MLTVIKQTGNPGEGEGGKIMMSSGGGKTKRRKERRSKKDRNTWGLIRKELLHGWIPKVTYNSKHWKGRKEILTTKNGGNNENPRLRLDRSTALYIYKAKN
jgi:hypothetical protein